MQAKKLRRAAGSARVALTARLDRALAELKQRECDRFNALVAVGTDVEYHPVIGEPKWRVRKTRTPASVLSGHTAVVWLEGEAGCVALDAVEVIYDEVRGE
jgi:hypothetical protein